MVFQLKRNLIIIFTLLILLELARAQDNQATEEEEENSSSEETIEDSNETAQHQRRRRRRAFELLDNPQQPSSNSKEVETKNNRAIPGLPNPAAILKIAEILTTVGQEVLPLLVQGNSISNFVTDRIDRDVKFIKNLKSEIATSSQNSNLNK